MTFCVRFWWCPWLNSELWTPAATTASVHAHCTLQQWRNVLGPNEQEGHPRHRSGPRALPRAPYAFATSSRPGRDRTAGGTALDRRAWTAGSDGPDDLRRRLKGVPNLPRYSAAKSRLRADTCSTWTGWSPPTSATPYFSCSPRVPLHHRRSTAGLRGEPCLLRPDGDDPRRPVPSGVRAASSLAYRRPPTATGSPPRTGSRADAASWSRN
jgi:hypothetical protein